MTKDLAHQRAESDLGEQFAEFKAYLHQGVLVSLKVVGCFHNWLKSANPESQQIEVALMEYNLPVSKCSKCTEKQAMSSHLMGDPKQAILDGQMQACSITALPRVRPPQSRVRLGRMLGLI